MSAREEVKQVLKTIERQPQRQDSLVNQLLDLREIAIKMGMYDASDFLLKHCTERHV